MCIFWSKPLVLAKVDLAHCQCDARPTVTFPPIRHHCPVTGTLLLMETRVWTMCPSLLHESGMVQEFNTIVASQSPNNYTTGPHKNLVIGKFLRISLQYFSDELVGHGHIFCEDAQMQCETASHSYQQVAIVMLLSPHHCRARNVQSYLPDGANIYSKLTRGFWDPRKTAPQTPPRSVQPFLQSLPAWPTQTMLRQDTQRPHLALVTWTNNTCQLCVKISL